MSVLQHKNFIFLKPPLAVDSYLWGLLRLQRGFVSSD